MSARAWRARKVGAYSEVARAERRDAQTCRFVSASGVRCLLNRRRHLVHMCPERLPHWAYGTNRRGRRAARRYGPKKLA